MSKNNRGRPDERTEEQKALLDELDSLKALLNKTEDEESIAAAPWEFTPTATPDEKKREITEPARKAVTEKPGSARSALSSGSGARVGKTAPEVPVLDEVVLPGRNRADKIPELTDVVEVKRKSAPVQPGPDKGDLDQLVEMLVEREMNKLKPIVTRRIIAELERLYPQVKKR